MEQELGINEKQSREKDVILAMRRKEIDEVKVELKSVKLQFEQVKIEKSALEDEGQGLKEPENMAEVRA